MTADQLPDIERRLRALGAHIDAERATAGVPSYLTPVRTGRRSWRLPVATAAAVVAAAIVGAVALRPGPHRQTSVVVPSAGELVPAVMTETERTAAVRRCRPSGSDTDVIVDGRPAGVLVGFLDGGLVKTCVLRTGPGPDVNFSPPPVPAETVSPQRPIVVFDAKAPDGLDGPNKQHLDGTELTWVWGRVDASVRSVRISTPAATIVPTVKDGLFAALWPGNDGDRLVVEALDENNTITAFVDQTNCAPLGGTPTPRLVVQGAYVDGGCIGGHDIPAGAEVPG